MRILLVEDDRRIVRFVAKGLREQAYAVDVTGDGDDAFYKLSINDYDAVILDVMIPGRDGKIVRVEHETKAQEEAEKRQDEKKGKH